MNSKIVWFQVHLVWLKCHKKKKADRLFERISNRHITNHNIFNGRLLFEWRERISFTSLYYVFMKVQLFHIFHWKQKTLSAKKHHSDTNKEEEKNRSIFEIIISAGNTQPRIDWLMNVANHNNNSEHNYTHTHLWWQYEMCLCPLKRQFLQVVRRNLTKMICIWCAQHLKWRNSQCVQRVPK